MPRTHEFSDGYVLTEDDVPEDMTFEEMVEALRTDFEDKTDFEKAAEKHNERSARAQAVDERYRSTKVTDDYETWKQNPSRWDFEGVDTVNHGVREERTEGALDEVMTQGVVSVFAEPDSAAGLPGSGSSSVSARTRGTHSPGPDAEIGVRSDLAPEQRTETLAHEIGHAYDYGNMATSASNLEGLGLGDNDPLILSERTLDTVGSGIPEDSQVAEEVREISEERRGEIADTRSSKEYREKPTELFADFFAHAITRPRYTKAKAPNAVERVGEILSDPELPEELEPTRDIVGDRLGIDVSPPS